MINEIELELKDTQWNFDYIDHDRNIARAIVYDEDGKFYFVRVERNDDFGRATLIETSGGGVEKNEDLRSAIKRELKEELGVQVEIVCKIGVVSDYYNLIHRHNINNYFLCKVRYFGEKNLTQDEIESFHLSTLRLSYEEAVQEYKKRANTNLGILIANRELPILKRAKEIIDGKIRMNKIVQIRKVQIGDEKSLAYIQTESWKAAFKKIVPTDLLLECTQMERAIAMYKRLLEEQKGNGYILEVDGTPHCIAYWDATREKDMTGFAELICIHSLKDGWHKGFGSLMMKQILDDVKDAGYSKIMLWVFDNNIPAIKFYEKHGFIASGNKRSALGAVEEMYIKEL